MSRRKHATVVVMAAVSAAAALCLATGPSAGAEPLAAGPHATTTTTTVTPHVLFGAHVNGAPGQQFRTDVTSLEQQIGRKLAVIHIYRPWDSPFPMPDDVWVRNGGRAIAVDISPIKTDGEALTWSQIADAQPGSAIYDQMVAWANGIAGFGAHVYVSFDHEPDLARNAGRGTPADFVAAWRHLVAVFRAHGATDVTWIWNVTAWSFRDVNGNWYAAAFYPGDDVVDAIGAEAYNWQGCRPGTSSPYRPFGYSVSGFRLFGRLHPDKPLMIMEYGSAYSPAFPGSQAQWLAQMHQTLERSGWGQVAMISYFDPNNSPKVCDWRLTEPSAIQAFADIANDPYFGATSPPVPGPAPVTAHGVVENSAGKPVTGATVTVLSPWGSVRTLTKTTTDSSGQWSATLAAGSYAIRITPPPGAPLAPLTTSRTRLWSGAHVTTRLQHAVVGQLHGTFTDPTLAAPLSGSVVQLSNDSEIVASATTDANGSYSMWAPVGSYTLTMTGPASSTLSMPLQLSKNTTVGGNYPDSALTVVVEGPDGSEVHNANVTIPQCSVSTEISGHPATGSMYPGTAMTNNGGAARFTVLPATIRIIATPPVGSGLKQRSVRVTVPTGQPVVIKLSAG